MCSMLHCRISPSSFTRALHFTFLTTIIPHYQRTSILLSSNSLQFLSHSLINLIRYSFLTVLFCGMEMFFSVSCANFAFTASAFFTWSRAQISGNRALKSFTSTSLMSICFSFSVRFLFSVNVQYNLSFSGVFFITQLQCCPA